MVRKRLIATVAVAPLLLFAGSAFAETTISNGRTTGVSTATINNGAPDDIKVTSAGKFELTTGGPAITQNSNNNVSNEGQIVTKAVDNAVGVLVDTGAGGITGNLTNAGSITHDDDYAPKDDDKDGDFDGDFAKGTGRYGIRVVGAGGLNGSILNSGAITIDGNESAGISVESNVTGTFRNYGSVTITGDNNVGIRITGDVLGGTTPLQRASGVFISGSTTVRGDQAIGIDVSGDIGTGADPASLVISGSVVASGYRYLTRPFDKETRDKLDNGTAPGGDNDLFQSGPAVRVSGNVTGGILVALPFNPATFDRDGDGKANNVDDDDDGDTKPDTTDDDDDNDGVLDTVDNDYDNDGIPDANEGTGAITVYGGAPALLIASTTGTVNIGNVGTNVDNRDFGLLIQGSVTSDGVYDNIASTAIQIGAPVDLNADGDFTDPGEQTGYNVDLNGGVRIDGSITARSYNNSARGLWLRGDVDADELLISGAIVAVASTTSASLVNETPVEAVAIDIGSTANVPLLNIGGFISTTGLGENVSSIGIRDSSGTLEQINVTGSIVASIVPNDDLDDGDDTDLDPNNEVINGKAIAIDVRNNVTGVTVRLADKGDDGDDNDDDIDDPDADGDNIDDGDEPLIVGSILFGSGNDTLALSNGALFGDMSFGLGNDTLTLTGGAKATGGVFNGDAAGGLDINITGPVSSATDTVVKESRLTVTNVGAIQTGNVTVGSGGQLFVTVDPNATPGSQNTMLVANNASFLNGSGIGLNLAGLIENNDFVGADRKAVYKIVDAVNLTYTGVNTSGIAVNAPFFYKINAIGDTVNNEVRLEVQRKSATEMGLGANQGAALDAIYEALFADGELANAFLSKSDEKNFLKLYDQLLPDQGEGLFSALDNSTQALFRLTATRPDMGQKYGPDSVWVQEINVGVLRDTGVTIGSETKAFGFIAGYESMDDNGGALGATLAYMNAEEKDDVAQIGEQTNVSLLEAGVYWRRNVGGWLFAARGAAGYGWFEGERRFIDPATSSSAGVLRSASATWGGFTGSANAMVAYEARFGRFYVRPQVSLDYIYLAEGERDEDGDIGLGLTVDSRNSSRLSAAAELAFGATFGRDNWWRPELRVGYRQHLAGEIGNTVAHFSGGNDFTLVATEPGDGAVVVGFSLKAGTPMSYVAVEGDLESAEGEDRYNLRLAGRMMF